MGTSEQASLGHLMPYFLSHWYLICALLDPPAVLIQLIQLQVQVEFLFSVLECLVGFLGMQCFHALQGMWESYAWAGILLGWICKLGHYRHLRKDILIDCPSIKYSIPEAALTHIPDFPLQQPSIPVTKDVNASPL